MSLLELAIDPSRHSAITAQHAKPRKPLISAVVIPDVTQIRK